MKKKILIAAFATVLALGFTQLNAKAAKSADPCNATACPGSGAACCVDTNGNLFFKGR